VSEGSCVGRSRIPSLATLGRSVRRHSHGARSARGGRRLFRTSLDRWLLKRSSTSIRFNLPQTRCDFSARHIRGSLSIPLNATMPTYVMTKNPSSHTPGSHRRSSETRRQIGTQSPDGAAAAAAAAAGSSGAFPCTLFPDGVKNALVDYTTTSSAVVDVYVDEEHAVAAVREDSLDREAPMTPPPPDTPPPRHTASSMSTLGAPFRYTSPIRRLSFSSPERSHLRLLASPTRRSERRSSDRQQQHHAADTETRARIRTLIASSPRPAPVRRSILLLEQQREREALLEQPAVHEDRALPPCTSNAATHGAAPSPETAAAGPIMVTPEDAARTRLRAAGAGRHDSAARMVRPSIVQRLERRRQVRNVRFGACSLEELTVIGARQQQQQQESQQREHPCIPRRNRSSVSTLRPNRLSWGSDDEGVHEPEDVARGRVSTGSAPGSEANAKSRR